MKARKKTILFLFLISGIWSKYAFTQYVFPEYSNDPQWNVVETFWFDSELKPYFFSNDSNFCGNNYSSYGDYYFFRTEGDQVFMRVDTICSDPEYLIYDFKLEVGDTMIVGYFNHDATPTEFRVDAIDTMSYFGINRKRMVMAFDLCGGALSEGGNTTMNWIEGIGSEMHPFYPTYCLCDACESWAYLSCYDSSGVQLYGNPYIGACDIIIDVPNISGSTPKIFPNPVSELLFFEPENSAEYFYNIRTITNNTVLKNRNSGLLELNVEELSPGIYFFELLNAAGQRIAAEKFVKL